MAACWLQAAQKLLYVTSAVGSCWWSRRSRTPQVSLDFMHLCWGPFACWGIHVQSLVLRQWVWKELITYCFIQSQCVFLLFYQPASSVFSCHRGGKKNKSLNVLTLVRLLNDIREAVNLSLDAWWCHRSLSSLYRLRHLKLWRIGGRKGACSLSSEHGAV